MGPDDPADPFDRGNDVYEGLLFLIYKEEVTAKLPWTSFTSRIYADSDEKRSSIRGNRKYFYFSYRSGTSFRAYSQKVVDNYSLGINGVNDTNYDGVREARFYFDDPVADDSVDPQDSPIDGDLGKRLIRLHRGSRNRTANKGTGSAGCLVSPQYFTLLEHLVSIFRDELWDYLRKRDGEMEKLYPIDNNDVLVNLWNSGNGNNLAAQDYNDKLAGSLWVIRPDERPLPE